MSCISRSFALSCALSASFLSACTATESDDVLMRRVTDDIAAGQMRLSLSPVFAFAPGVTAVTVSIENGTDVPLSLSPATFTALQADGLRLHAIKQSTSEAPVCLAKTYAPRGGVTSCVVAFAGMLTDESVVEYRHAYGSLSARFDDAQSCAVCGGECVDLESDRSNCGDCGNTLFAHESCAGGEPRCNNGYERRDGRCEMI